MVIVFLPLPLDQMPLITRHLCWVLDMKAFMSICHHQTLSLPFTFPTTSLPRFVWSNLQFVASSESSYCFFSIWICNICKIINSHHIPLILSIFCGCVAPITPPEWRDCMKRAQQMIVCAESGNFSWWVYCTIVFLLNVIECRMNLTNWSTHQWIRTWWEGLLAEGNANCDDGRSDTQQFMLLSGCYATQQHNNPQPLSN